MGYVLPRTVIVPAAPRAQRPRVATRAALQRQQSRAGRSGARAATLVAQRGRARTVLIHAVKIHDGARGREQIADARIVDVHLEAGDGECHELPRGCRVCALVDVKGEALDLRHGIHAMVEQHQRHVEDADARLNGVGLHHGPAVGRGHHRGRRRLQASPLAPLPGRCSHRTPGGRRSRPARTPRGDGSR